MEGGASNQLIRTGSSTDNPRTYKTKNYQQWEIKYFYKDANDNLIERWEITKENGVKYIYGGIADNPTALQYIVKWGNWIGNSSQATGAEQQATAWNLARIKSRWNDEIKFEYYNIEEAVLNTGKIQTVASYLSKITDVFGREVIFNYLEKNSTEYQEPHTEISEPDAYQERYEDQYLSSILVNDKNNDRLFSVVFTYYDGAFLDNGQITEKRLLKSITQKNELNEALAPISFNYYTGGTDINRGALASVDLPTGGNVTFNYAEQTISHSNRTFLTPLVPEGYSEPKVVIANDYAVATFRNGNHVIGHAYSWDGEWVLGNVFEFDVEKYTVDGANDQNYVIRVEKDFFSILTHTQPCFENGIYHSSELFIFTKDPKTRNSWNIYQTTRSRGASRIELVTGNKFVALSYTIYNELDRNYHHYIKTYIKEGINWFDHTQFEVTSGTRISGTNNFFFTHNYNNSTIQLRYLNETGSWITNTSGSLSATGDNSMWSAGNSLIAGTLQGTNECTILWDENYNFGSINYVQQLIDESYSFILDNCFVAFPGNPNAASVTRFDGVNWHNKNITNTDLPSYSSSAGIDYFIRRYGTTDWTLYQYNPNINDWITDNSLFDDLSSNTLSLTSPKPRASYDYFIFGYDFFVRNDLGNYVYTSKLTDLGNVADWRIYAGQKFIAYGLLTPAVTFNIIPIKNGELQSSSVEQLTFSFSTPQLVGGNTIITYNNGSLGTSTQLELARFVSDKTTDYQIDYSVSYVTVNDGYTPRSTAYKFDASTATIDPSGTIAQYNNAKVILGTDNPDISSPPYGYTKTYFMNGLSGQVTDVTESNAADYYNLLKGSPYKTEIYNSTGTIVSSSVNYYKVEEVTGLNDFAYYARAVQKDEMIDGITSTTKYDYNPKGLLTKTTVKYTNTSSQQEDIVTENKYLYEVSNYQTFAESENLLSPVVKTTTKAGSTVTGESAATWKQYNGKWAPYRSFVRKEAGSTDIDWSNASYNQNEWLKTSEITAIDETTGLVLESTDIDEVYSATKYGYDGAVTIAQIINAKNSETSIADFEDGTFGDWDDWSNGVISNANHTGTKGWHLSSMEYGHITKQFQASMINTSKKYTVSGWVKTSSTYPRLLWAVSYNGGTMVYPLSINASGTGDWQYLECSLDLNAYSNIQYIDVYGLNGDQNNYAECWWDDLRFAPSDAIITTFTYDPKTLQPTSKTDANNVSAFYEYDNFNRLYRTINDDAKVISQTEYYLSRSNNFRKKKIPC